MRELLYEIKKVSGRKDIGKGNLFFADHFQWNCVYTPKTFGRAVFLEDEGIYLEMTCQESDPRRLCTAYREKVCLDSAVEAFFAFGQGENPVTNDDLYINYEINANAMLYGNYGRGRDNRQFISDEIHAASGCTVELQQEFWTAHVLLPRELFEMLGVWDRIVLGDIFYCNFYKISEAPETEHYGCYSPIENKTPNFHLPVYFAHAKVV